MFSVVLLHEAKVQKLTTYEIRKGILTFIMGEKEL